jgi:ketosteroid isomerase-like protein
MGDIQIGAFTLKDEKVHVYGDVAVVTGQTDLKGTDQGNTITGSYRWTDVFVRREGSWQVVASQAAVIRDNE